MRSNCNHGHHEGVCGYKYVQTIKYPTVPLGLVREILVDVCRCVGDHE